MFFFYILAYIKVKTNTSHFLATVVSFKVKVKVKAKEVEGVVVEEVEEVKVKVEEAEEVEVEVEEVYPQFQPVAEVWVPHYTATHNRYTLIVR